MKVRHGTHSVNEESLVRPDRFINETNEVTSGVDHIEFSARDERAEKKYKSLFHVD